ncbi:MAG: hypothetical protein KIT15_17100 [Xanthobacteraceae bacterium]|nr:hypothetical protein [Xanthobacteraceae bacterium]
MTIFYSAAGVNPVFLGSANFVGGSSGHTFTGQPLGDGRSRSLLVVAALSQGSGTTALSGVNVASSAATEVVKVSGSGWAAGLYYITGVSGTGDVEIVLAGATGSRHQIQLVQLRGVKSTTPNDFDSYTVGFGGSTTATMSLDVPKLGACVACAWGAAFGITITWSSNISDGEVLNVVTDADGTSSSAVAKKYKSLQSPLALTATYSSASAARAVAASWR